MNQQEFYKLPEVREQIEIQKSNPYGSKEHKSAYFRIGGIAKENGVWDEYVKSGGNDY